MAGIVKPAYRKKVPEGKMVSINTGFVSVMKKPVTMSEKLPIETASPLIRVGNISLTMTQTIGPYENAKLAT